MNEPRIKIFAILVVVGSILLCACSGFGPLSNIPGTQHMKPSDTPSESPEEFTVELIDKNESLWKSKGVTDYDMTVDLVAGGATGTGAHPVLISVRNGQMTKITAVNPEDRRPTYQYDSIKTVDDMFRLIRVGLEENTITGIFNQELGYPESVNWLGKTTTSTARLRVTKLIKVSTQSD